MKHRVHESALASRVKEALNHFVVWLDGYGETSWDHQSYFGGAYGRWAKGLYYRNRLLGTAAVAPMIASEALIPAARRLFHHRIRFPIADAHYAMGFAFLYELDASTSHLDRATHFLQRLTDSRCVGYREYAWGYPFDWVTRNGVMPRDTPLITSTPYMWEAFLQVHRSQPREAWLDVLRSIARHASTDFKDFPTSAAGSSCSYTPTDGGGVINAAAYRAFLLCSAAQVLQTDHYWTIGERNLRFVLENQNADGSWYYATDGVRDFVDHFHTCFVLKALAKIHGLTQDAGTLRALRSGVDYYTAMLFDADGLPKPFARAPRLTVYRRELYDCAESINLCLLLRDRFPKLADVNTTVIAHFLDHWIKPDGSFRSRRLHLGWDNLPMHRWGQSQMFRSLAFFCKAERDRCVEQGRWPVRPAGPGETAPALPADHFVPLAP